MLRAVILVGVLSILFPIDASAQHGERRGEIGLQIGVRKTGDDILPEGDNGLGFAYGVQGAWALSEKWAIFGDLNISTHDSRLFCRETVNCNALTPESKHKVLNGGFERRFKSGPKGGRWLLGAAIGYMDLEWRGAQVHHGLVSVSFGRRGLLGGGALRWCVRVETGFSGRTDPQLWGALDKASITNALFLVGWGTGFGARY
jgi:hypothetical protein